LIQVHGQDTSAEAWSARYEQLRANWLNQEIGWGQSLFIRQGMAAWMKAWPARISSATRAEDVASESVAAPAAPAAVMSGGLRRQLARELANLILHRQQEVLA
jgi:hypothetical protein